MDWHFWKATSSALDLNCSAAGGSGGAQWVQRGGFDSLEHDKRDDGHGTVMGIGKDI